MAKPGIGDTFQQETKYQRGHLPGGRPDWASKPATYKRYPSAPKIPLSPPQTEGGQLKTGDFRTDVARAALDQETAYWANVVFVWTAVFERSTWKYKQRAYRYAYLDAGHIAQNVALAAVTLGLGSCQIAALYDDEVNGLLGVDGVDESAIYMTVVGKPK